jgi:hypothetical protein
MLRAAAICPLALLLMACGITNPLASQRTSTPRPSGAIAQGGGTGGSNSAAPSGTLTVDKAGFGGATSSGFEFWDAGAIVTNHSDKLAAMHVAVQATATDAAGQTVGTGSTSVSYIRPGQSFPVAVNLQATSAPAKVTVLAAAQSWGPDSSTQYPGAVITGTGILVKPTGSQYYVNATLNSTYPADLTNVVAFAVCTDASGNISAAAESFVQLLPARGQTGVQFIEYGAAPASCQVVGVPSG